MCIAVTAQGPSTVDAAASAQAVVHAVVILLALGAVQSAPPAAKALLRTLAKLLAAHAPDAALRAGRWVSRLASAALQPLWQPEAARDMREDFVDVSGLPATSRVARGRMRS